MLPKVPTKAEDTIMALSKYDGPAVFSNSKEDHLRARIISLLDGDILPLPTFFDLERDNQRIAFAVRDATGVTLEEWARMDKPSREVCLERTLAELTKPVTVWRHGERSYSVDGCDPVVVTAEEAFVLAAFEKARSALDTRTLEKKVSNVARIISRIESKFPRAVRRPSKKGEGYYIRVQPATVE